MSGTDLQPFNTLRLPCQARAYRRIVSPSELADLPAGQRRFVLGGGSNVVFGEQFDGLILHMGITGRRVVAEDSEAVWIEAGAGENWHDFVQWTLAQGYPGLENLSLIPGTVGAAPIQNIGAYGLEAGERIAHLRYWDVKQREFREMNSAECRFAYRDSRFKQEGWHLDGSRIIVSVTFRLPRAWTPITGYGDIRDELAASGSQAPTPASVAAAVISIRQRKLPDPALLPNAGSFFHNPIMDAAQAADLKARHPTLPCYPQADGRVKLAAGWLIEQAGWKGRNLGPVGMYAKQALVMVNHSGGNSEDILRLMRQVQDDVRLAFAVNLTPEPVFP